MMFACILAVDKDTSMRIFNIFRRKQFKPQPRQLRIDGCKTVMTAAPDDSELAAQALLESLAGDSGSKVQGSWQSQAAKPSARFKVKDQKKGRKQKDNHAPEAHDAAYYQELSEKIRTAHEQERRMAMRYVSYVEEQLSTPLAHREGQGESPFATLEHGLYKHQDVAERDGGELLKRWQHCLAECIMRQMTTTEANGEYQSSTETTDKKE